MRDELSGRAGGQLIITPHPGGQQRRVPDLPLTWGGGQEVEGAKWSPVGQILFLGTWNCSDNKLLFGLEESEY